MRDMFRHYGVENIPQNNPHHFGDLIEHTAAVLQAVCEIKGYNLGDKDTLSKPLVMAAIFHDIGKPDVVSVNPKTGYDQYLNHAEVSVEKFAEISKKLKEKISFDEEYVSELIRLHDTKYSKQGKINTLLETHKEGFAEDLIVLQIADVHGQSLCKKEEKLEQIRAFAQKLGVINAPV